MMNSEEFDRKIEFIVAQQAQFVVDIQLLREAQSKTDQKVAQLTESIAKTDEAISRTNEAVVLTGEIVNGLARVTHEGFKQINEKINALVDSQLRKEDALTASQKRTDERFEELAVAQKRTDEMLQKFLRGLRERRNGK